jgi:hypothetical protein
VNLHRASPEHCSVGLVTAACLASSPAADNGAGPRLDLPLIVFHGDRDATVHPRNSEHVLAQAVRQSPPASTTGQLR